MRGFSSSLCSMPPSSVPETGNNTYKFKEMLTLPYIWVLCILGDLTMYTKQQKADGIENPFSVLTFYDSMPQYTYIVGIHLVSQP